MEKRIIGVDNGNNFVKVVAGGLKNRYSFSNIIAAAAEHRIIAGDEGSDPLDTLHYRVCSPALGEGNRVYVSGNLATGSVHLKNEIGVQRKKYNNDQILIHALLSIAIDAAETLEVNEHGYIDASGYMLATGLPLNEVDKKSEFRKRLTDHVHEIQFLQVNKYAGKRVKIRLDDVAIYTEGPTGAMDLSEPDDDNVNALYPNMQKQHVLLVDIGGGTTEGAILKKGRVDSLNSVGKSFGASVIMDRLIEEIFKRDEVQIQTRQQLINEIYGKEHPNKVMIRGVATPVMEYVKDEMEGLASRIYYEIVDASWKKVTDLQTTIFIGGGSILLKECLEKINQSNPHPLGMEFLKGEDSIWINARSYYKCARIKQSKSVGV
ncbi:ParM/StbA family protein [Thermoactinomyces sp. DSM 45892]|uniref:ParM/StbA family protein n=1 Tax=Thermoactinomyces sp. DSM 45892 TaxID=1882753 RepID=UPI000895A5F5|nr:ParM/StbA family protein [Thermoactinomyces sp. DSM 45892]SDY85505.1 plasmid segregation protein ParM [Thermoactinomyces sp. DSM 45892]